DVAHPFVARPMRIGERVRVEHSPVASKVLEQERLRGNVGSRGLVAHRLSRSQSRTHRSMTVWLVSAGNLSSMSRAKAAVDEYRPRSPHQDCQHSFTWALSNCFGSFAYR